MHAPAAPGCPPLPADSQLMRLASSQDVRATAVHVATSSAFSASVATQASTSQLSVSVHATISNMPSPRQVAEPPLYPVSHSTAAQAVSVAVPLHAPDDNSTK